jgi:hypothetical protein
LESSTLRNVAVQVCHYFKDFLESDFRRQQAPRRRIILQSDAGFRTGMRVRAYPTLESELWSLISRPSGEPMQLKVGPRKFTRSLSPVLRKIVEEHVRAIDQQAIDQVREATLAQISRTYSASISDPEKWVDDACTFLREQAGDLIVRPLVTRLDAALQRTSYNVVDSVFTAESEMVAAVTGEATSELPAVLARHLARRDDAAVAGALAAFLTLNAVQATLTTFFDGFVAADAFLEFRDLETFAAITEGVQLYLYIGSCRFRSAQYPLFFVPVQVDRLPDAEGFQISLGNQLFANRAAIDFVLQELAQAKLREWAAPIQDRINYLKPEQSIYEVARHLFGLVGNSMDLAGQIQLSSRASDASTADVTLSTALHLCVFERGEEALVNDYEELIALAKQGGSAIVTLFEKMVRGVLRENPKSVAESIEADWERMPLTEKLVFDSPIPLNEEQRKILLSLHEPDGWITVVEGPPGTGKSHTITAIAADCAVNQKSCLVLSDKAEALQVVQDKLSEAMSRVRHVEDFPNPLLRLGRQDANFKKLVANQTVNQVTAYVRAVKANHAHLVAEKKDAGETLKQAIDDTIASLGTIDLARLKRLHDDEAALTKSNPNFLASIESAPEGSLSSLQGSPPPEPSADYEAYVGRVSKESSNALELRDRIAADFLACGFAAGLGHESRKALAIFEQLDRAQARELATICLQYRQLRMPLFGYLFRGAAVRALELRLSQFPTTRVLQLSAEIGPLETVIKALSVLRGRLEEAKLEHWFSHAYRVAANGQPTLALAQEAKIVSAAMAVVPGALESLLGAAGATWVIAARYLREWTEVRNTFSKAPEFDYVGSKTKLERLNTSLMNAHVDGRLVRFMENHRADAKTLSQLIAQRQKFPEHKFDAVRSSFPIIIASIREFGEYMPLVPELFDVVVIDEASQVSVAQALPALLRAKKVVVLGDSKQFSNVKSTNASIAINDKYRANLVQFFERNVSQDAEALQRLSMFDVKRSVLEFCGMAASYSIMLRKHFRSYPELISYSSNTFYNHQLQAIKVRGVPLDDVVRFELVDPVGHQVSRTTNTAEAEFIEGKLLELLEEENPPTVGVITPFREQHTLLTKRLLGHARAEEFESRLRLKVMTFDTCQGEERQIIFYSLVATPGMDALNYIFPVSLSDAEESVEEKLKVQRLNVGFSRAQEMIWIVHSMQLEQFRGAIAGALNHYAGVLRQKHGHTAQVDPSSPMESRVLGWLHATSFVQEAADDVEILPQFPIGEYLKQLDPTYQHPSWRVDFLLTYRAGGAPIYIVVEYDGFEFHFKDMAKVHVGNHERYLRPEDVERQLTLESYGYRFLRINRFNLGKDPVQTLDQRLRRLVEMAGGEITARIVDRVREQAEGMTSKEMRQCRTCSEIKPLEGFFDSALKNGAGGYGFKCVQCKASRQRPVLRSAGGRRSGYRRWA